MLSKEKGITLIALIITIIVMLILVGVTINVALDGELFKKAEKAKEETIAATEEERLLMAVLETLDDNGKFNLSSIKLPADAFKSEVVSEDDTKVVYQGLSGKQYEVSKTTGAITEVEEKKEDNDNGEEDDDTPPENITSTIWESREVTSANVKFDTLYYVTLMDSEDFDTGLTFGLYSNGDMCLHFERNTTATTVPKEDGNGNNLGDLGRPSDIVQQYYDDEVFKTFSNGLTMPVGEGINMTIRYTSENTIEVYIATLDEIEDDEGEVPDHIPADEKYKVATLIPQ